MSGVDDLACEGCGAVPCDEHASACPTYLANMRRQAEEERLGLGVWARMLIDRDKVQGPGVLRRMIAFYEEHDDRAWDFGELWIVKDARSALEAAGEPMAERPVARPPERQRRRWWRR
jgi:hypothetical protein